MANYETLKSAIQQVVKTNGNNEITGALLQQSLLAIINSLGSGYQYVGVATPTTNPGTPDQRVFYIANGKGTYANFGGLSITEDEVIILYYDTTWHKMPTGVATLERLSYLLRRIIIDALDDEFIFADGLGKVAAKINANGLNAKKYNICDALGNIVYSIDTALMEDIKNIQNAFRIRYNDGFYFSDPNGNVVASVDKNGIHAVNLPALIYRHPLSGKHIWAVGDSHSMNVNRGHWMNKIAEMTGALYDDGVNSMISTDHTNNPDDAIYAAYEKHLDYMAKSVAYLKDLYLQGIAKGVDVIFIENTHWSFSGNMDNIPFVGSQVLEYNSKTNPFPSNIARESDWNTNGINYLRGISSANRKTGTSIKQYYKTISVVLTFSANTIHTGTFTLTIDGHNFAVNVTAGMTLADALTALNSWKFSDYTDWKNQTLTRVENGKIELSYIGTNESPTPVISFVDNGTGITLASQTASTKNNTMYYYFNSKNVAEWETLSNWSNNMFGNGYTFIKGLIELTQSLFPKAEIIMWSAPYLNWGNNYLYDDGSIDFVAYKNDIRPRIENQSKMLDCAAFYDCKTIDVMGNIGITPFNYQDYYNLNNVHPKPDGYKKWGETLIKLY